MNKIIESLKALSDEITDAKTTVAVLKSKREECMKTLKEKYGVKTIEAAQNLLEQKESELVNSKEFIEKKFKELKEDYQW